MEAAVYILCSVTACASALLLLRGYRRNKVRLLLWCGLFFCVLTLENIVLFLDLIVLPDDVDLSILRSSIALLGVLLLLYGLVMESK